MAFANNSSCTPKLLLVGSGLRGGGAEARLSRLAPNLFNGYVDIALLSGNDTLDAPISGNIIYLKWKSRLSYPKVVWNLWKHIRKRRYEVIMAFGLFPITVSSLAIMGMTCKPKFIVSEITRPLASERTLGNVRRLTYYYLRRLLYKRGDLITANSIDGLVETCQIIGSSLGYAVRLPNIVDIEQIRKASNQEASLFISNERYIICVGRLTFMKRMDTVLSALDLLKGHTDVSLVIVGEGDARRELEALAKSLGLEKLVTFTGNLPNPLPLLKRASVFVLASEYEGFSNSVLEAMFCDVPVITSLCSSDAREMCDYGAALGFEVEDAAQLSKHMAAVINDESIGQKLVNNAKKYREQHEIRLAIPVYEDLILTALKT